MRWLFARLETTPGQERVILTAFDEVFDALRDVRGIGRDSLRDVAAAIRDPAFDAERVGSAWAAQDSAIERVRHVITTALQRIHEALDEKQRLRFAELLESGPFGPWTGFGRWTRGC